MKTTSLHGWWKRHALAVASVAALGVALSNAQADFQEMIGRVPADANAVIAIDVDGMLSSGIAKAQGWGTKEETPLFLQRGTDRVLVASRLNLAKADSDWDVAVLEMNKMPSAPSLLLAESGVSDKLGGLDAIWSSRRAYFIMFDSKVLGIATPDDRQFAARWARQQANRSTPAVSAFLQSAAAKASASNPLVMGLDLQDAISQKKAVRTIQADLSRAAILKDLSAEDAAAVLATLKGVVAEFQFADDISGKITVDFGYDPSKLLPIAGPLLGNVLTHNGMAIPEIAQWDAKAPGNRLVYTGKLSLPAFMKLSILLSPTAAPTAAAEAPAPGAAPAAAVSGQDAKIAATKRYFRAVCATLDAIGQPASLGDSAAVLKRASLRIERLPMTDVDPEVIGWATRISADFLGMATQLAAGQTQVSAIAAGSMNANVGNIAGAMSNNGDDIKGAAEVRAERAKMNSAQFEATQNARAQIAGPIVARFGEIMASKMAMRATLVQRYNTEF